MRNLTEENVTDAVLGQMSEGTDPRVRQLMTSLLTHLHDFIREVELTPEEWMTGIKFLTAVGQKCDERRQEFVLLSDTLGASILVDAIHNRARDGSTESSLLGPFYRENAKELPPSADIALGGGSEPVIVSGQVLTPAGQPIAGALLDVWQAGPNGLYDVQDPDQPDMNLRGKFLTDAEGRFQFRTVKPSFYGIPSDGPVGAMLRAVGRHPNRPAHLHFKVSASGYRSVTTTLFTEGDPYLDSDAVLGVKSSLVVPYTRHDPPAEPRNGGEQAPYYTVTYDFVLAPAP